MSTIRTAQDAVRGRFTGELIYPHDDRYDDLRRVYNGLIDMRPALIARCHSTADVIEAVVLGREHREIAIRGGGHNVAGLGTTDGGLMIDLSPMKGIRVDRQSWRVWAQPGLTWRDYDRATALHGLATTGGVVSSTGIAGLTLGGGEGWLMGRHGLTVDNLVAAEVVTAEGEILTASADDNADLFWALRGGGGNFGVVTAFEYRAHPVRTVTAGPVAYALSDARAAAEFYRELSSTAPDELTAFCGLGTGPDGAGLFGISVCHCGGPDSAERDLRRLKAFSSPVHEDLRRMPYPEANTLRDAGWPRGALNYWKSAFLRDLCEEVVEAMLECFADSPSPLSGLGVVRYGGAVSRVDPMATAFTHRRPGYSLLIAAQWLDPAETERNLAWARETFAALAPWTVQQSYVNNLSADEPDAARKAFGVAYQRLTEVKRRYDPHNVFRRNHNIDPS